MSSESITPPLSQGWGYGVAVGLGIVFALAMMLVTHLLFKYNHENNENFETYSTAGRSVGVGLTAVAVISSWAWSTALLSSSVMTYSYGVSGAYWFGAGCVVQICTFSVMAIQSKIKTPHAHTILEVVRSRYGTTAHFVYMALCLINNLIAVVNMLLGASATFSTLTGMHVVASVFLLPIGVTLYTVTGGLRATFVTDWAHTVALYIIVVYLSIKTLRHVDVGGFEGLWEGLRNVAQKSPVSGNENGSYMTMTSPSAVEFGVLHTLGNFGLVIMDSSYWQKAYSADNAAAVPGYILGGATYFGLPWCLGTVMGLAALVLQGTPSWPAFGRALSEAEQNAGLVMPYTAITVAGKAGAVAVVFVVFMAVTSTMSAELIAVSSIVSSDVYHTYIRPQATGRQVIRASHLACIGFAIVGAGLSVAVHYGGVSLTWTLYFLGVVTCPGMVTMPLTVLWSRQSKAAAIVSPLLGLAAGLATWLATATRSGPINVRTTGLLHPCLYGTVVSAGLPVITTLLLSFVFPDGPFDWNKFQEIQIIDDSSEVTVLDEVKKADVEDVLPSVDDRPGLSGEQIRSKRASVVAGTAGVVSLLVFWVIWPFVMYGCHYEFSRKFLGGWLVVSIIWAFAGLLITTFLAPIDGWRSISTILRGLTKRT